MKKFIILACVAILSSCASQKLAETREMKIISIAAGGDHFIARSGRTTAEFNRLPGDSIWIGKVIDVSIGKKLK